MRYKSLYEAFAQDTDPAKLATNCPEGYAGLAQRAESDGEWFLAARWYIAAQTATTRPAQAAGYRLKGIACVSRGNAVNKPREWHGLGFGPERDNIPANE
ncbi:MAG TPA: hypothetical protein VF681_05830 [Abditibacteriaceae bacterium]|jgi:hypothetical protein